MDRDHGLTHNKAPVFGVSLYRFSLRGFFLGGGRLLLCVFLLGDGVGLGIPWPDELRDEGRDIPWTDELRDEGRDRFLGRTSLETKGETDSLDGRA